MQKCRKRLFSIYLPQFHPIPENDLFWGKGFTEWHNVTSAKPLFEGHYQPQLPTELGFYDLRLSQTMEEQSKLASEYGIEGFLFYHYWFNGKPVMNVPLQNYLNLSKNKLPYFFCWANENWTRTWDGGVKDVLLSQDYSMEETEKHFSYLFQYFKDERYVKIDNCPVIVIYKPFLIPQLQQWVRHVRAFCAKHFNGVYLIYMIHPGSEGQVDINEKGFDAGFIFEPSWKDLKLKSYRLDLLDKLGKLFHLLRLRKNLPLVYRHNRIDYEEYVQYRIRNRPSYAFKHFPVVFPGWDNSSRRKKGGANIFVNSDPGKFCKWLQDAFFNYRAYSEEESFVIINAWNEWAEGNHLEPCTMWGRQYLEAVRDVVEADKAGAPESSGNMSD